MGTYAIQQGTLALSSNYNLLYTGGTFTILARPINVTADAKSKVYGDADPVLTYGVTGTLIGSDAFTGALTRVSGENAGTYGIQQGTLALGSNYDLRFTGNSLTILQRPITVTAAGKTKVYGDADPALIYTVTGSLIGTDAFTGALSRTAGENVGTYSILQGTLALSANYDLKYLGASLGITPTPLSVTPDNKSKIYGDVFTAFTGTVVGLKFNDPITATYASDGAPAPAGVGAFPSLLP